ncbi:MAG: tetratricopeptide repeat protein, partial [Myxococcota bacterium]
MDPRLAEHRQRFEADPDAKKSFAALEEHHFMAAEWDELVALYERRLGAPSLIEQPELQADLMVRQGRILEERRDDADGSIERYLGALRLQPDNRAAIGRLRRVYMDREAWGAMFSLAETEAELPLKHPERAGLLSEIGRVCLDRVRDTARARSYFERALSEVPEHREALGGLARVFEKLDEPAEAVAVLVRLGQQTKGTERARALQRAGDLSASRLGKGERAIQLFRAALDADPSLQAARADLARLEIAQAEEVRAEESRDVRDLGEATADGAVGESGGESVSGDEVELLEVLGSSDRESEANVETLLEAANLAAAQGEASEAMAHLERGLQQNPKHIESLELLAHLLVRSQRFEEAIDVLERLSDSASDPSRRGVVFTRMGCWFEEHLEDSERARAAYERALQADPSLIEPFAALCQLHRKTENWAELRSMLQGFRRFGDSERRVGVTLQLGELLEGHFDDVEGAAGAYREALDLDPEETRAQEGLARLDGDVSPEERRIRRSIAQARSAADPSQRREIARQLIPLLEQAGRAEEALEWAHRCARESDGDRETLETLARLQEALGREEELRETLGTLDPFLEGSARAGNRIRMAESDVRLGRQEQALAGYQSALEIEPNNRRVLEGLVPLLKETERFFELAKVRETLAGLLDSPEREACLDELATIYVDRLDDLEAGIRILVQLDAEPSPPPDLGFRLEILLSRAGHFEDLADRLARRRAALAPESPQALELARKEARIRAEHLEQWREAADALLAAGSGAFDHSDASAELEQYVRAGQDDALLVEVLAERATRAVDPASCFRINAERARILEGFPERRDEARDAYRELLLQPPDADARADILHRLGTVLELSEDWAALRDVLDTQLELAPPDLAAQLHERLGWLCIAQLRDHAAAIGHFENLVSARPEAPAWQQLAKLYAEAQQSDGERRALEGWLAADPDTPQARELHARLARLCEGFDDRDAAFAHHAKVFELDPSDAVASEFLVAAHQFGGQMGEAVKVFEARLAALGERGGEGEQSAAHLLRLRIAEQRADALDDLAGAIGVLEPAAVDGPEFELYAEPLGVLYERAGRLAELIELSKRVVRGASSSGERARWQLRIAEAARTRGFAEDAIDAYRSVLALWPGDPRVESALAELYRACEKGGSLVEILEATLVRLRGAPAVPLHLECAAVLDERLSRPGPALDHVRRALEIDPENFDAIRQGVGIAGRIGDASAELEFLDRAIASATRVRDRVEWLLRRGELQLANGEEEATVESWREVLSLDPRQRRLRARLREQLEKMGRIDEALQWLAVDADQSSGEASAALCEEGVELALRALGPDAGLPWLERLCRLRPSDASHRLRLADLNQQLGRHAAALRALGAQADLALDVEIPDIELRRARIYEEHLGLPARAIECLEAARDFVPDDVGVLRGLEGLYSRVGRHRDRAQVLETLLGSTEPGARLRWVRELADLWGGPLADPQRAADCLREVLAQSEDGDSGVPALLARLRGALLSGGGRFEWAQVAERELGLRLAESGDGSADEACRMLRLELARTYESELCRPDLAVSHWESLVDANPADDSPNLECEEAEVALLRLLRSQGRLLELEGRLDARVERGLGGIATASELANLRERLQLVPQAAAAWRRVLELDSGSIEGVRGAQRTADRLADWPGLAEMVEREIEIATSAPIPERAALLRRLADVRLNRLGDTDGARAALEAIVGLGEGDLETFRTLETLLESMQAWDGLSDVYHEEVKVLEQREPERRGAI